MRLGIDNISEENINTEKTGLNKFVKRISTIVFIEILVDGKKTSIEKFFLNNDWNIISQTKSNEFTRLISVVVSCE